MTPEFPLISIYKHRGLDIYYNEELFRKISTYTFIKQAPNEGWFYDRNGKCWNLTLINNNVRKNFLTHFLANTIYNPVIDVELDWKEIRIAALEEIKRDIFVCIDNDDDVITQFEEGDVIKRAIDDSQNFDEIIFALNKYVFKVDEQQLGERETG